MLDPRAVANLIILEMKERGYEATNLKLQKLLFLSHSFYLVEAGRPLVKGHFEAWQYGPVHREVYDAFKENGGAPIQAEATRFNPVTGSRSAIPIPADRSVVDVVKKVVGFYGGWSAGKLVDLTHAKGSPWDFVVENGATRSEHRASDR